jgi:hypothetical protein
MAPPTVHQYFSQNCLNRYLGLDIWSSVAQAPQYGGGFGGQVKQAIGGAFCGQVKEVIGGVLLSQYGGGFRPHFSRLLKVIW